MTPRPVNFAVQARWSGDSSGEQRRVMRYTYFEFENFKGMRKTRLDLGSLSEGARVFTLVGLNESGKTTILEAIDQFQRSSSTDEDDVSPTVLAGWIAPDVADFIPVSRRMNFNGDVSIRVGIALDDDDFDVVSAALKKATGFVLSELAAEIEISQRYQFSNSVYQQRRSSWTNLTAKGKKGKGRVDRSLTSNQQPEWVELTRIIRKSLPPIWFFPNFLFEFPERIYLEPKEDESSANRFYRALFQDILDALGHDLNVDKHVVQRARSNRGSDKRALDQVLLEAERNVTTTVVASWNRIFSGTSAFEKRVQIRWGDEEDMRVCTSSSGSTTLMASSPFESDL
jgi:hypothetical protein